MHRPLLLCLLCCVHLTMVPAQSSPLFTWMGGADTCGQAGEYGTRGVASASNIPGARRNSVSGADTTHQLWLFGGYGAGANGNLGYLNDLWKYHTVNGTWTWVSGDSGINQPGAYGTKGVPAPANHPGARQNAVLWVDGDGNLWLFGGEVSLNNFQNDLWKYDVLTDQWTWMAGTNILNDAGVYGTKGTGASSNSPSARYGAVGWYENGHLWLFGGQGNTPSVRNNDLWEYDISAGTWTWVSGSNTPDQAGTYGTLLVSASGNVPGARQASVTWQEGSHLWLLGGYGIPASGAAGYLDDLWRFDVSTQEWTWMWGTTTTSTPATYGSLGVPSPSNAPGARQMSVSFTDTNHDLWLFGGWGYGAPINFGRLNDLWKYDILTGEWTWMAGASSIDQPGVYGTLFSGSPTNIPGARRMGIAWTDHSGAAWLFGGYGYDHLDTLGLLNDMWKMELGTSTGIVAPQKVDIQVFPNPASDLLRIILPVAPNQPVTVSLFDAIGREIRNIRMDAQQLDLSLNEMAEGLYVLQIRQGSTSLTKNILIRSPQP